MKINYKTSSNESKLILQMTDEDFDRAIEDAIENLKVRLDGIESVIRTMRSDVERGMPTSQADYLDLISRSLAMAWKNEEVRQLQVLQEARQLLDESEDPA